MLFSEDIIYSYRHTIIPWRNDIMDRHVRQKPTIHYSEVDFLMDAMVWTERHWQLIPLNIQEKFRCPK